MGNKGGWKEGRGKEGERKRESRERETRVQPDIKNSLKEISNNKTLHI